MKTNNKVLLVFVFFMLCLWGIFYFLVPNKMRQGDYYSTKPNIDVQINEQWAFKHCTPTNKDCGRFE